MMKQFHLVDIWSLREKEIFSKFQVRRSEAQETLNDMLTRKAWKKWTEVAAYLKKIKLENEQRDKVVEILSKSVRGQRTTIEKEQLRRFIMSHLTCIPKSITFSEMDQLCNELDWIPLMGRSILFLQGDFGNVYYMVARGNVGLYLEPSKDREMSIAREFGALRAQPFLGTDEDLNGLGNRIFTCVQGSGFGEYAILASSNKIRSCAAVAMDEDSLLFIMHADTYNAVLRQHHYRQKQLSSATALLSQLPLFKNFTYSKIASLAYTMKSQTYTGQSTIVNRGTVINNVILIVSGEVKVYAEPHSSSSNSAGVNKEGGGGGTATTGGGGSGEVNDVVTRIIEKRIPRLAVSLLGKGQIIGEVEMQRGQRTFQLTYVASSAVTEVLEMPATVFKENVCNYDNKQTENYKEIERENNEKEAARSTRIARAYEAMKGMMGGTTREVKSKDELMAVLPILVDPIAKDSTSGVAGMTSSAAVLSARSNYHDPDRTKVTRKQSFGVTLSQDESIPPRMAASLGSGKSDKISPATAASSASAAYAGSLNRSGKFNPGVSVNTSGKMSTSHKGTSGLPSEFGSPTAAAPPSGSAKHSAVAVSPRVLHNQNRLVMPSMRVQVPN